MIKHKFEVKVGGQIGSLVIEDQSYTAFREAQKKVEMMLWQAFAWQKAQVSKVRDKDSIHLSVSWECTMNGRAPSRPKDVIAAEKAARAAKGLKRREERERWEKERQERIINTRKRIKQQVDHAFSLGKTGTEPAAKYITCDDCSAPAHVLVINQELRDAHVLDEDTIIGAACANHIPHPYNKPITVDVSRLEFFYDGIR